MLSKLVIVIVVCNKSAHNNSLQPTPNASSVDVGFRCFGKFINLL